MKPIRLGCLLLILAAIITAAQDRTTDRSERKTISSVVEADDKTEDMLYLEVGFSKRIFYSLDIQDAAAALHVIVVKIVEEMGESVTVTTRMYENNEEIITDLKANQLDVIAVLSEDLPELLDYNMVDPFLLEIEEEGEERELNEHYVLCARTELSKSGLKALENKKLIISDWIDSDLPDFWMEVLLHDHHLPSLKSFFSQIERIQRSELAVMRIFFRKADACLVPKQTFQVLMEMNPQIANEIAIIEESPGFVNGVICLNKTLTEERDRRSLIEETLLNMKQKSGGEQLMTLFKIYDWIPYNELYLQDTFEVIKRYRELNGN